MKRNWRLLVKHQLGAVLATIVDFLSMIAWVELGRGNPVTATAIGAGVGATTNFLVSRQWIFKAQDRGVRGQMFRYALVSVGSLGLNSLGQALALRLTDAPYVAARVFVAAVVGLSWNFPLHRRFVFKRRRAVTGEA